MTSIEMDSRDARETDQLEMLNRVFSDQLLACLEECARGRKGLFSDYSAISSDGEAWPEAERLRELSLALQGLFMQQEQPNALCDEFLELCSIHGESHPGEPRLARTFLTRIERGEVGSSTEVKNKLW